MIYSEDKKCLHVHASGLQQNIVSRFCTKIIYEGVELIIRSGDRERLTELDSEESPLSTGNAGCNEAAR